MDATRPTPFPDLDEVLHALVAGARAVLEERFVAAYLLGSFAIGDFDVHSDVDFAVAIEDDVPEDRLAVLQDMHGRIHDLDCHWAKRLDGSYIPQRILRRRDPARTPLLYLDNGSRALIRSAHCNTLVVRWMIRECGIPLSGPDPRNLIDPIAVDDLRREASALMQGWAKEIRSDPQTMNNRWYQPYAVLSYCRMLYTLETGTIASKPAAARWAQEALGPHWSALIQRALDERPDPSLKVRERADPGELERTLAFIDHALRVGTRSG